MKLFYEGTLSYADLPVSLRRCGVPPLGPLDTSLSVVRHFCLQEISRNLA